MEGPRGRGDPAARADARPRRSRVAGPDGQPVVIARVVAVVEGAAKAVDAPEGVVVVRAPKDGDSSIVSTAEERAGAGERVLVVTADRGLRARLAMGS